LNGTFVPAHTPVHIKTLQIKQGKLQQDDIYVGFVAPIDSKVHFVPVLYGPSLSEEGSQDFEDRSLGTDMSDVVNCCVSSRATTLLSICRRAWLILGDADKVKIGPPGHSSNSPL
jgi:hypothetical protein